MEVKIFILGLAFGSFVNALVWRMKKQATSTSKKRRQKYSITKGRSQCPHCSHRLSAKDLIPVFSWVALRGKCRYCKKRISAQYPIVELLTAGLFLLSFIYWPVNLVTIDAIIRFGLWLAMLTVLMALTVYDVQTMILPDRLVYILGGIVLVDLALRQAGAFNAAVWLSALVGLLSFGGIFYVLYQVSKGRWIGGGDVKLGFVLGAYLANWQLSILAIYLASIIGLIVVIPSVISGKTKLSSHVPFGPMLIAASIVTVLFGQDIIGWYIAMILPQ